MHYLTYNDIVIEIDLMKDVNSELLPTNRCIQDIKRSYGIDVSDDGEFAAAFSLAAELELDDIRTKFSKYYQGTHIPNNIRLFNVLGAK